MVLVILKLLIGKTAVNGSGLSSKGFCKLEIPRGAGAKLFKQRKMPLLAGLTHFVANESVVTALILGCLGHWSESGFSFARLSRPG